MTAAPGRDADDFDAVLPALLGLDVLPPAVGVESRRGRRVRSEFGEFAGHVPYAAGEDLRFLDWTALARSGQRVLRRFDAVEQRRLDLTLDLSASMAERGDGLIQLARLLVFLGLHRLDAVDLTVASDGPPQRWHFAGAEASPLAREVLLSLRTAGSRGLLDLAATPDDHGEGAGLRVVVSDFEPETVARDMLVRRAHEGCRLLCVFPRTPLEAGRAPPTSGTSRIVDRETGRVLEATLSPALYAAFLDEQRSWEQRLRQACLELGHDLLAETLPDAASALRVDAWLPFLARGGRR